MKTTPILQFGTSRFLQAHADLFVSEALANGQAAGKITVVQSTGDASRAKRLTALANPAGFPVRIRGIRNGQSIKEEVMVSSVARTLSTQTDWPEICRIVIDEADYIVSNTSDNGYNPTVFDGEPEFRQEMSYPAKLMHLLLARFLAHRRPIQVMPMELIVDNGQVLKNRVLEIAEPHGGAFRQYLTNDVIWVNSLVDRIVSEPIDPAGAVAEPYALWAIEDQSNMVLPCEHDAIQVVRNLELPEAFKLFILNLGHTYLVHQWQKSKPEGILFVRQLMQDDTFFADLKSLYQEEVLPGFVAAGQEQQALDYIEVTLDRFANPFLDHRLSDIMQNHREKIERRVIAFMHWATSKSDASSKPRLKEIADSIAH